MDSSCCLLKSIETTALVIVWIVYAIKTITTKQCEKSVNHQKKKEKDGKNLKIVLTIMRESGNINSSISNESLLHWFWNRRKQLDSRWRCGCT